MNAEQKAIDEWFASEEGKQCCDAETLETPQYQRQYLRNRLWKAFVAGMGAGKQINRGATLSAVEKFLKENT